MTHDDLQALCEVYAAGALDGEERRELVSHLPLCPGCRQRVLELEEALTLGAAFALPALAPPPALKERVLAAVRAPGGGGAPGGGRPPGGGGAPGWLWALAAAAVVAVPFAWAYGGLRDRARVLDGAVTDMMRLAEEQAAELEVLRSHESGLEAELGRVRGDLETTRAQVERARAQLQAAEEELRVRREVDALLQDPAARVFSLRGDAPAPQALGRVVWRDGRLGFVAAGLPALPEGFVYELWALPAGGSPRPAGLFTVDADGRCTGTFVVAQAPADLAGFGLTKEPRGGRDTPTAPLYMVPAP